MGDSNPIIPDKRYFTIGEVGEICDLKSHVLRYWEQVFPQLSPSKRRGRRYYQRADLELILQIKRLLYEQGYTIPGAKARLDNPELESVASLDLAEDTQVEELKPNQELIKKINQMRDDLRAFRSDILQRY
jgi:DNA-binding transcriptional MerR regulator